MMLMLALILSQADEAAETVCRDELRVRYGFCGAGSRAWTPLIYTHGRRAADVLLGIAAQEPGGAGPRAMSFLSRPPFAYQCDAARLFGCLTDATSGWSDDMIISALEILAEQDAAGTREAALMLLDSSSRDVLKTAVEVLATHGQTTDIRELEVLSERAPDIDAELAAAAMRLIRLRAASDSIAKVAVLDMLMDGKDRTQLRWALRIIVRLRWTDLAWLLRGYAPVDPFESAMTLHRLGVPLRNTETRRLKRCSILDARPGVIPPLEPLSVDQFVDEIDGAEARQEALRAINSRYPRAIQRGCSVLALHGTSEDISRLRQLGDRRSVDMIRLRARPPREIETVARAWLYGDDRVRRSDAIRLIEHLRLVNTAGDLHNLMYCDRGSNFDVAWTLARLGCPLTETEQQSLNSYLMTLEW
jgi:hypothetical protein